MKLLLNVVLITIVLFIAGCESSCCENVLLTQSVEIRGNQTPVPIIKGVPTSIVCGSTITADGRGSYDLDGSIVHHIWVIDGIRQNTSSSVSTTTLPCDNKVHKICLTVTDDKNASQKVCQQVRVNRQNALLSNPCDLDPKVTFEKVNNTQKYNFSCKESTYNGQRIDDQTASECTWLATENFIDGNIVDFSETTGATKTIDIDLSTFQSLDLTLTVKNSECERTLTQHYILPEN
ncbi:MAG: hypothetical protein DSZ05_06455 [Sulfurospirillum sp.]|nr:MAG: hypothetical protein DSZ05_06455 [Sulfurospirillum sp.]